MTYSPDEAVGAKVRALRGTQTQAWVCERLSEHGLSWYPMTVLRVERGDRPVRLTEAPHLAHVLGVTVTDLLGGNDKQSEVLGRELSDLRERIAAVREAVA